MHDVALIRKSHCMHAKRIVCVAVGLHQSYEFTGEMHSLFLTLTKQRQPQESGPGQSWKHRSSLPRAQRQTQRNRIESAPHFCVKRVLPALFIAADARLRVSAFPRRSSVRERTPESTVFLVNPFESSRCRLTRGETRARSLMSEKRAAVSDSNNHCERAVRGGGARESCHHVFS